MKTLRPAIATLVAFAAFSMASAVGASTASAAQVCIPTKVPVTKTVRVKVTTHVKGHTVVRFKTKKVDVRVMKRERVKVHGKFMIRTVSVIKYKTVNVCTTVAAPATVAAPTVPIVAPAPVPSTISYKAAVDPTFIQSPTNPLAVTFAYSADATQTQGAVQTDLNQVGQLPSGILDMFSDGSLACSMNVGGSTDGGSCPVTYAATGQHTIVTEYIPNGATAVSQTEVDTINPFSTTTSVSSTEVTSSGPGTGEPVFKISPSIVDQNGNVVTPGPGQITYELVTPNGSVVTSGVPNATATCEGQQSSDTALLVLTNTDGMADNEVWVCGVTSTWINEGIGNADSIVAIYTGTAGYLGATSAPSDGLSF